MEAKKTLINNTGEDITVTLFIRDGDSPADEGATEAYDISGKTPANEIEVVYEGDAGSEGYVFLNALLVEWTDGGNKIGVSRRVAMRGDAWDNTLNTNSTINITKVAPGTLDAAGSN